MTDFNPARTETRTVTLRSSVWHMLGLLTMATASKSLEHFLERLASGEWNLAEDGDEIMSEFKFTPRIDSD